MEKNVGEILLKRFQEFNEKVLIHEKKDTGYIKTTWNDIYDKVLKIGSYLISSGVTKNDKIASIGYDCNEILALELACMSIGCVYVPIFSGYYPKQIEYILSHSDPKYVILSDESLLQRVLSTTATGRIEKYFLIKYNEKFLESTRIFDFSLLLDNIDQDSFTKAVEQVNGDDVCLLLYTSGGATGISKGVQIKHESLIFQHLSLKSIWDITDKDIILSYFPWHHSLGIIEKFLTIFSGATFTVDRSPGLSIDSLIESLNIFKPTICFGDAGIYYDLIQNIEKSEELENAFFHNHLRFAFASASPSNQVIEYFDKKNVPLLQGWGMTETLQYVTVNTPKDNWQANTSGFPIPGIELQISEGDNEIYLRGKSIIKEYYKDEEKTNTHFTDDNWFKTGDSGEISKDGLIILGRIDSIFYLKNKTKVFASNIEKIIESSSIYVGNCVIFGENQEFIGALIFPSQENLVGWYKENNGYTLPLVDMLDEQEVIDLYRNKLRKINNVNLHPNQKIKYFTLIENAPSVKAGELTSAHTLVRKQILENYKYLTEVFYLEEGFFPELKARIIEV
jgi:long-chain acyl-CoA synthetase